MENGKTLRNQRKFSGQETTEQKKRRKGLKKERQT